MTLAAVTMVYNEPDYLPIWAAHYAREVGARHCYVIDHGSDDGSTAGLGEINVVRIPRSPQDEDRRARFVSHFCGALLEWYDRVIHTDADEIALADPRHHTSLVSYCEVRPPEVTTALGFDLPYLAGDPPYDPSRTVTEQRPWARFHAAMCKPVLIARPVNWPAGFHRADAPVVFDQLYLFHLRWFDRDVGLRRLARTRAQPWADPEACWWQRVDDARHLELFDTYTALPRRRAVAFDPDAPPLSVAIAAARGAASLNQDFAADELWALPAWLRGRF
ncbi:MAG: glycosyltransferase family 2 protein [Acidisphaera sp.]|nr:glycosyltransferase family 2 protein [Acidisphaera sp.]